MRFILSVFRVYVLSTKPPFLLTKSIFIITVDKVEGLKVGHLNVYCIRSFTQIFIPPRSKTR